MFQNFDPEEISNIPSSVLFDKCATYFSVNRQSWDCYDYNAHYDFDWVIDELTSRLYDPLEGDNNLAKQCLWTYAKAIYLGEDKASKQWDVLRNVVPPNIQFHVFYYSELIETIEGEARSLVYNLNK